MKLQVLVCIDDENTRVVLIIVGQKCGELRFTTVLVTGILRVEI